MPDINSRVMRLPDVQEHVGLRRSAIYELVKRGDFPRPIKLSKRAVGWRESDVLKWLASRPETAA